MAIPQSFQTVAVAVSIIGASDAATEYVNKPAVVRNEYKRTVLRVFFVSAIVKSTIYAVLFYF